ncbi:MAG: GGDEF domain-containing protein [Lachnospiraceae bacterium]|nr:GGDEF domain-containing protein [Lachnospiraceae bacterium]
MFYASIGLLSLVLHMIINHEVIANKTKNKNNQAIVCYRQFLFGLIIYYLSDALWGFFCDLGIVALTYADTVLYFASMTLTVLLWVRYVVAYIDRKGLKSTSLIYAGYVIWILSYITIAVNFFIPIIFKITPENQYVPGLARYFIFGVQFCLDALLMVYSFIISFKVSKIDSKRYRMVGASGLAMSFFIFLQMLFPDMPFYAVGCIIATCLVHVFVEETEKSEQDEEFAIVKNAAEQEHEKSQKAEEEMEIFNNIAYSLASDYEAIYYIDIETGRYREFAPSERYEKLNIQKVHEDFYKNTLENIDIFVYPEDKDYAKSFYTKENMLKLLENKKSHTFKYRLVLNGKTRYFMFFLMMAKDGKHFVLCDKDIQDALDSEKTIREKQEKIVTFGHIAESLAANYDVIYYVNIKDNSYVGYNTHNIYGQLEVERAGDDFFTESMKNSQLLIHPQDRFRFEEMVNKDYMLSGLESKRQLSLEYRMIVNDVAKHTRLIIRKSSDKEHFIIGVENIDDEVRKEKEYLKTINTEKELARRDELTGVKNKTAYSELEKTVQSNIDNGMDYFSFAVAVCDVNNLKVVNDTKGHKAGDDYIKASAKMLCDIFDHSPVFRVGGDEFVVFLRGEDFINRVELEHRFRYMIIDNLKSDDKPIVAIGLADYIPGEDNSLSDVFEKADNLMYEDKRNLKNRVI